MPARHKSLPVARRRLMRPGPDIPAFSRRGLKHFRSTNDMMRFDLSASTWIKLIAACVVIAAVSTMGAGFSRALKWSSSEKLTSAPYAAQEGAAAATNGKKEALPSE